jgi:hypothetical protein
LEGSGDNEAALGVYQELNRVNPDEPENWTRRGVCAAPSVRRHCRREEPCVAKVPVPFVRTLAYKAGLYL